jgi:hypothetical protein
MESLITKPRVAAWIADAVGAGEPHPVAAEAGAELLALAEETADEAVAIFEQLEAAPDATVHARMLGRALQQQLAAAVSTAQALKTATEN